MSIFMVSGLGCAGQSLVSRATLLCYPGNWLSGGSVRSVKLCPPSALDSQQRLNSDVYQYFKKGAQDCQEKVKLWEVTHGTCPKLIAPGHRGCDQRGSTD